MRSSIAEELQSISVTSFRLLPLAMPALPGKGGQDAVRTDTLPPQLQLVSLLGFRNPSPHGSYETENHRTAEPHNSTSGGLTAHSRAAFAKPSLQPIAPLHSDHHHGKSSPGSSRDRARAEQRAGVFLSTPETGAAASLFSTKHSHAAGGNLQCHLHSSSTSPM